MAKKAIGYKDGGHGGSYGFKFTEDGQVKLGNSNDDVIQITGSITIDRATESSLPPAIQVNSGDYNHPIIRTNYAESSGNFGWSIRYMGAGSGDANRFALTMDNTTGTDVDAILVDQDGDTTFGADVDVSTHDGSSNGFKLGGTLVTATAAHLNHVAGVTSNIQTQLDAKAPSTGIADGALASNCVIPAKIATSVAGDGLSGGGGSALSVNVDDSTIDINSDTLRVKPTANMTVASVTGSLYVDRTTAGDTKAAIVVDGDGDTDVDLIRVKNDGAVTHGFAIRYLGDGNGDANRFALTMDNQGSGNVDSIVVDQDGQIKLLKDVIVGTTDNPNGWGTFEIKQPSDDISNGFAVYNSGESRSLRLWVDGSDVARIDSGGTGVEDMSINYGGGQVTIGNASVESDNAKLEVHQSSDGGGQGLLVWGSGTSGNKAYFSMELSATGVAQLTAGRKGSGYDCDLAFRTSDGSSGNEAEKMRLHAEGELTINTDQRQTDEGLIQIKQKSDSATGGGLTIIRSGWTDAWTLWQSSAEDLYFSHNQTSKAYISDGTAVDQLDFTGQHRCYPSENDSFSNLSSSVGKIVVSSGDYKNLNLSTSSSINESIPTVELSSKQNQKSVFGVVSSAEDNNPEREYSQGAFVSVFEKPAGDDRLYINSLGEGGIWITNINGNIENGDYITTCEIPGYGMKQDDDLLHNYTVAKITQDCLFDLNSTTYECEEIQHNGQSYRAAFVGCTYHCG
tara:strand:+ start:2365 stop:4572 length:2208 start_codon:yes stop_codon:yes gene_type:complete